MVANTRVPVLDFRKNRTQSLILQRVKTLVRDSQEEKKSIKKNKI